MSIPFAMRTPDPIIEEDVSQPVPTAPYQFETAFASDHFVYQWTEFFSQQCDAAYEFFEAAGLLALSLATHAMSVHLWGGRAAADQSLRGPRR
jgi:hypothetical protein